MGGRLPNVTLLHWANRINALVGRDVWSVLHATGAMWVAVEVVDGSVSRPGTDLS